MVTMNDIPFQFIEREGFYQFMNFIQPNSKFMPCTTVVKDLYAFMHLKREDREMFLLNFVKVTSL